VSQARARVELTGRISDAETLWYDMRRWPLWIDGFGHVAKIDGEWPGVGSVVVWDSVPDGRGRVVERVTAYEPRVGQTLEVEDARITGRQHVGFEVRENGFSMGLALEYRLKQGGPVKWAVDAVFIRRAMGDSLRRTLTRFGRELAAEGEPIA
jgi:hypothetical protein